MVDVTKDVEKEINRILHGIAIDLQESLKDKLNSQHGKFTGALQASIRVTVEKDKLVISMEDYGENLEFGLPNPTSPDELEDWVKKKILKGNAKEKTVERISENMAQHISKFGPRPFPFIRPTLHADLPNIIRNNLK